MECEYAVSSMILARMATIVMAFENAISETFHIQSLGATENGVTSMCRGKHE